MTDHSDTWLNAANPLDAPRDMVAARRKARVAVPGMFISLVAGLPGMILLINGDFLTKVLVAQNEKMGLSASETALQVQLVSAVMPGIMIFASIVTTVLYGVAMWAQWRHVTRTIPIVLLVLAAHTLLSNVVMRLSGTLPDVMPVVPPALYWLGWTTTVVTTILYVSSLRGAVAIDRMKKSGS